MFPYLNFQQSVEVNRTPDALFKLIDGEDLTQKMFQSNKYNLIATLEQTEPIVYSFKHDVDFLGRKNAYRPSSKIFAAIEPRTAGSQIHFTVKTNPQLYLVSAMMLIGLILNLYYKGPIISNIIFVIVLGSIVFVDLRTRKDLLKRTKTLLTREEPSLYL